MPNYTYKEKVDNRPPSYLVVEIANTLLCPAGAFEVLALNFKPYAPWFTGCWLISIPNLETQGSQGLYQGYEQLSCPYKINQADLVQAT